MPTKRLVTCILADDAVRLPMPDRGGRHFSAGPQGETVNLDNPYYAAALAAGDIVEAETLPADADIPAPLSSTPPVSEDSSFVSGEPLSGAPAKTSKRSKSKGPDHG